MTAPQSGGRHRSGGRAQRPTFPGTTSDRDREITITTTSDTTLHEGQQHPTPDSPRRTVTATRTAGWAAILFATVPLAVLLVPHEGIQPTDSGEDIVSFFTDNWAMQQWQPLMHSVATLAFVLFVVALERSLATRGSPIGAAAGDDR